MRTKKVSRYWCDFCNKGGQSRYHMERHEKHCTLNPNRDCRMCVLAHGGMPEPMQELLEVLPDPNTAHAGIETMAEIRRYGEGVLNALREKTDGCPACMLAALRQKGLGGYFEFNFEAETKAIFAIHNQENSGPY